MLCSAVLASANASANAQQAERSLWRLRSSCAYRSGQEAIEELGKEGGGSVAQSGLSQWWLLGGGELELEAALLSLTTAVVASNGKVWE